MSGEKRMVTHEDQRLLWKIEDRDEIIAARDATIAELKARCDELHDARFAEARKVDTLTAQLAAERAKLATCRELILKHKPYAATKTVWDLWNAARAACELESEASNEPR